VEKVVWVTLGAKALIKEDPLIAAPKSAAPPKISFSRTLEYAHLEYSYLEYSHED
jgi:hypothetical protein